MKRLLVILLCMALMLATGSVWALAEDGAGEYDEVWVAPATDYGDTGLAPDESVLREVAGLADALAPEGEDAEPEGETIAPEADVLPPEEIEVDLSDVTEEVSEPAGLPDWDEGGPLTDACQDGLDNDEAIAGYIDQALRENQPGTGRMRLRAAFGGSGRFSGTDAKLYDALKAEAVKVAAGELGSTSFSFAYSTLFEDRAYTPADLGLTSLYQADGLADPAAVYAFWDKVMPDVKTVTRALLADSPYEFYWYDKTIGMRWYRVPYAFDGETIRLANYESGVFTVDFAVAKEYSATNATGTYETNTQLGRSVKTAAQNAANIVLQCSSITDDLLRMEAYKNRICDLVSYNSDAVAGVTPYGNPWQLIWVFDGDAGTNVVCEGYAKAFQYLCDLTTGFQKNVSVISVTGKMKSRSQQEPGDHMWNVVRYDGVNYLVDATNCDTGTNGTYSNRLFMRGYSYIEEGGAPAYCFQLSDGATLSYIYDEFSTSVFSASELALCDNPIGLLDDVNAGSVGGLTWRLGGDGALYITGNGPIPAFSDASPAPWDAAKVKQVTLSDGVTAIGAKAFRNCANLTKASVPDSVTSVADDAFAGCSAMTGSGGKIFLTCRSPIKSWVESHGLSASVHHADVVTDPAEEATCIQAGKTQGSHCAACGDVIVAQVAVKATGHKEQTLTGTDATCTAEGLTDGTYCTVCGVTVTAQKTIPAKGHSFGAWTTAQAATCAMPGSEARTCSACETVETRSVPATGLHTYGAWTTTQAPTCTQAGTEMRACEVCGNIETRSIAATGHSPAPVYGYDSTCASTGLTDGVVCSACGETLEAQQPIALKAHTPAPAYGYDSTCYYTGLTDGSYCSVCGATLVAQQPIGMKAHTPVLVTGYLSTYDYPGVTDGSYCAVCGVTLVPQQVIPQLEWPARVLDKNKNNGTVTVNLGEKVRLVPQFAYAAGAEVTGFKSGKAKVAEVDGGGLVTALAEGKAKITVTTSNKKQKATITVVVVDPYKPMGIGIAQGKAITLTMGQPVQLGVGLTPATARATLTWKSNKAKVATVDGNGVVYPVGEGKAKITVTTHNKKKATIAVTVVDPYKPLGVSIAQGKAITLSVGQAVQLYAGLNPVTAQSALTWKSNKAAVATVDGNGVVIAQKKGKAKITVMTYNKKKATITVNVVD